MRQAIFLAIITIAITGCAHFEQLPSAWGPAISSPTDSCPNVDGTYADKGEISNGSWSPSLIRWIFPTPYSEMTADRVLIKRTGDILQIRTLGNHKNDEFLLSRQRGEFRCSDGLLQLPFSETFQHEHISAVGSGTLELSRTKHFLVVNRSHQDASLLFIVVPIITFGNNYGRFALVE